MESVSDLNTKLVGLVDDYQLKGKILTTWTPLSYMPKIGKYCIKEDLNIYDVERMKYQFAYYKSEGIKYLLFPPHDADPQVNAYVENELKNGRLICLKKEITYSYRKDAPYSFYEINY